MPNNFRCTSWRPDCYRQDLPQAALPVLFLLVTTGFWGFRPAGATRCTDHSEIWQGGADPDRLRGGGLRPPKLKKWNFTNIIAHKGRVCTISCTIFTKFIEFMRILSLHNLSKFGCFISINEKIINNLFRWGRFQPNFRRPLAAKLWMGAKNVLDLK